MTNTVQGNSVVLSFFKEDWVPFLCATDITVSLTSDVLPVRTVGDGHWAKNTYQSLAWTVSISGALRINQIADADFSGLDIIDNQLNFNHIRTRCTFYDDAGNIKSLDGYCMVQGINFGVAVAAVVKNDIALIGNGELRYFDGLLACDSLISTITVTGQTAADGIVHITYTYTGAPAEVKYKVDGQGNWVCALIDQPIEIPSLSLGSHSIEMLPVCVNGYEADNSTSQSFVITQALTCSGVISSINITTTTATPIFFVSAPSYKYSIDGGAWVYVTSSYVVPLGGLSVGAHSIEMVPICSNSVEGTGFTQAFTVASQPAQSTISWSYLSWKTGQMFNIYVNGVNVVSTSTSGTSGSIIAPTGATVKGVLQSTFAGSNMELKTTDTTIITVLDDRFSTAPDTLQYSFTASGGDSYLIQGILNP